MVSYHKLISAFRSFGFRRELPVITHIGSELDEKVKGGLPTFMGALLSTVDNVLLPAFTYSTMVIPHAGPPDNNINYGNHDDENTRASIYSHTLPSECGNQQAIDILKAFPGTYRSSHPIFSFYGLGLDIALINHEPETPYYPIKKLEQLGGWVLLADAEPIQNYSIHYAEKLAGRKQFLRWALTPHGIAACPHYPGCADGFNKLNYYLHDELKQADMHNLILSAIPLSILIKTSVTLMQEDPFALLCNDLNCARCNIVREDIKSKMSGRWRPEKGINSM